MPRVIFVHRRLYSCCARCRTSSPCASHLFASAPARPVLPLPARGRRAASPRRLCAPPLRGAPALPAPPAAPPLWSTTRSSPPPPLRAWPLPPSTLAPSRRACRRAPPRSPPLRTSLTSSLRYTACQKRAAIKSTPQAKARRRRRAPRSGGGPGAAPPASSEWVGVRVYLSMPVGMPCAIVCAHERRATRAESCIVCM